MKKKSLLLFIVPILLTSCGNSHRVSFEKFTEKMNSIVNTHEHPYYHVQGYCDYYAEEIMVDWDFDKQPEGDTFTPFARYNEGFYLDTTTDADILILGGGEDDVLIYGMASHSYFLRMPLYINQENWYAEFDDAGTLVENPTCAHARFQKLILNWYQSTDTSQPSSNYVYYEDLGEDGFAIGGSKVHTVFYIDNHPLYPDPSKNPLAPKWTPDDPYPALSHEIDAKVSIRFEYNKDGWLTREYLSTIGYDHAKDSKTQVYLESYYTYKFN